MTIVINETLESRTFSTSGDEFVASRSFICYDNDEGINAEVLDVLLAGQMPQKGQSHPDAPHLYASTYTASHSSEGLGVWEVTWEYKPVVVGDGGDNPLQPDEEEGSFTGLNVESTFTPVDIYKAVDGTTFVGVNIDAPEMYDDIVNVGDTVVAKKGGDPITFALPTVSITITQNIVADRVDLGGSLKMSAKRNLNPWLGLDAGSVVYKGVSMTRTGVGKYTLTYNFFWDKWYHLRQVPNTESGIIKYNREDDTMEAYWRQPFPEKVDFGFLPEV